LSEGLLTLSTQGGPISAEPNECTYKERNHMIYNSVD
jgi:hypothetical protein